MPLHSAAPAGPTPTVDPYHGRLRPGDPLPEVRELPPDRWPCLLPFEPFATGGLPNPDYNRIMVAEVGGPGGPIVAFWMALTCVHVEPLWIHPDHRARPGLIRRLWMGMRGLLQERGVTIAFACITDQDAAANVPLALRQGFQRLPGDLYHITVPPAGTAEE